MAREGRARVIVLLSAVLFFVLACTAHDVKVSISRHDEQSHNDTEVVDPPASHKTEDGGEAEGRLGLGGDIISLLKNLFTIGFSIGEEVVQFFKNIFQVGQTFPTGRAGETHKSLDNIDRRQQVVDKARRFPCATSFTRVHYFGKANNVRELGPADIDVVAAIGDSVTAGTGGLAESLLDVMKRSPQQAFLIGGGESWREYLTIPNILREYNPSLYGYSTGSFGQRGLNLAKPGAMSADLIVQAKALVSQFKSDQNVSYENDWKFVSVLAGGNDLCENSCKVEGSEKIFQTNMKKVLDILFEVPRIFINVISVLDPSNVHGAVNRPLLCQYLVSYICPCIASGQSRLQFKQILSSYRRVLADVIHSGRYSNRTDAAVVLQTGLESSYIPQDYNLSGRKGGNGGGVVLFPDLSYLSPDCFHPSQKLNALAAKEVWSNLFEPSSNKSDWSPESELKCPSKSNPFFSVD